MPDRPLLAAKRGGAAGLRRTDPTLRRAEALADGYRGLPEGVTRWRLAAALRAAASSLDLTASMLQLLEHYIDLTYDIDWIEGAEPVVTRPLVEIADHLGRSERQVRNIERALVERGLLVWRDSGNHHRKGRRDRRTGRLTYAYGPSLAPLGARAAEIIQTAQVARAELSAARRLRIAISALRRRLRAELAAAGDEAPVEIADAFAAAPARMPAGLDLTTLAARRDALAALASALTDALTDALASHADPRAKAAAPTDAPCAENAPRPSPEAPETSAKPEICGRHETDTTNHSAMNGGIRREDGAQTPTLANPRTPRDRIAKDHGVRHVSLSLAWSAAGPELRTIAQRHGRGWPALIDSAREIAPLLGVGAALWGSACHALGRHGAALAVLVLERGATRAGDDDGARVRRPDAYLRGLIARAEVGALHLDRSVRAWARRPG